MQNTNAFGNKDYTVKVIVAAHKKYPMPEDPLYLPVFVGAEGRKDSDGHPLDLGYQKDNTGENISIKNPGYCELTGLYWAWKNLSYDYIGLVHYRRHFAAPGSFQWKHIFSKPNPETRLRYVLTEAQLEPLLSKYVIFVPEKRHYVIETLYSHYEHTHYKRQLDLTRRIIKKRHPEYLNAFDRVMKRRWGYMFNMSIMRRDYLDSYCTVLFDILFTLERHLEKDKSIESLSSYQARLYGRIGEIFFNVWLEEQIESGAVRREQICELELLETERINWARKGTAYLAAKFFHKRYEGSF